MSFNTVSKVVYDAEVRKGNYLGRYIKGMQEKHLAVRNKLRKAKKVNAKLVQQLKELGKQLKLKETLLHTTEHALNVCEKVLHEKQTQEQEEWKYYANYDWSVEKLTPGIYLYTYYHNKSGVEQLRCQEVFPLSPCLFNRTEDIVRFKLIQSFDNFENLPRKINVRDGVWTLTKDRDPYDVVIVDELNNNRWRIKYSGTAITDNMSYEEVKKFLEENEAYYE